MKSDTCGMRAKRWGNVSGERRTRNHFSTGDGRRGTWWWRGWRYTRASLSTAEQGEGCVIVVDVVIRDGWTAQIRDDLSAIPKETKSCGLECDGLTGHFLQPITAQLPSASHFEWSWWKSEQISTASIMEMTISTVLRGLQWQIGSLSSDAKDYTQEKCLQLAKLGCVRKRLSSRESMIAER